MDARVFVVDSSPAVRRIVERISTPEGFEVVGFQDGPTALEAAKRLSPHLIIADYHLDNITFSGFCTEINKLDNLSETLIVSLVTPADRVDEQHLRSLGVKAFLKKPFQSDHLLDIIKKSLLQNGHQLGQNGTPAKRRSWPPETTSTDTDGIDEVSAMADEDSLSGEQDTLPPTDPPTTAAAPATPSIDSNVTETSANREQPHEQEAAVKGLFDRLLPSHTVRAEQKVSELVPDVLSDAVVPRLEQLIDEHLSKRLSETSLAERLGTLLREFVQHELPAVLNQEISQQEPAIRQLVEEMVAPHVRATVDSVLRDLVASSVRQQLSDVVREQLGSIELVVKAEVQRAASTHAQEVAGKTTREIAQEKIDQVVPQIVLEIAETQVKEEIKRLSSDQPSL